MSQLNLFLRAIQKTILGRVTVVFQAIQEPPSSGAVALTVLYTAGSRVPSCDLSQHRRQVLVEPLPESFWGKGGVATSLFSFLKLPKT